MSAHTPGPWHVANLGWIAATNSGDTVCAVYAMRSGMESEDLEAKANARLIAASPDLLEAVIQLLRNFPTDSDLIEAGWEQLEIEHAMKAHDAARAVVARATGEQP